MIYYKSNLCGQLKLNKLNQKLFIATINPNIFNGLRETHLIVFPNNFIIDQQKQRLLIDRLGYGWLSELFFHFGKQNTRMLLLSSTGVDPLFSKYCVSRREFLRARKLLNSEIICSLTIGEFGYSAHHKKALIAINEMLIYIFRFLKKFYQVITPILIRTRGSRFNARRHFAILKEFLYYKPRVLKYFAFIDSLPISFGHQRLYKMGRKRYRYYISNRYQFLFNELNFKI